MIFCLHPTGCTVDNRTRFFFYHPYKVFVQGCTDVLLCITRFFFSHPCDDDRPSTFQTNIEIEGPPRSIENQSSNRSFSSQFVPHV